MRSRIIFCIIVVMAAVTAISGTANAAVIDNGIWNEDYCYWFADGSVISTANPDPELELSALVWVQQTVYEANMSAYLLNDRFGKTYNQDVFLYAYTVTNQAWEVNEIGQPITGFGVDWGSATLVESLVDPDGAGGVEPPWQATSLSALGYTGNGPAWIYVGEQGLPVGGSIGGFWAVALTKYDRMCDAGVVSGTLNNPGGFLTGKTTGPVPEPTSILALAVGLVGTLVRLRRK